jgi:hypothetical protein
MPKKPLSLEIPGIEQPEGHDRWAGNEKICRCFAFEEDFQRNSKRDCLTLELKGALSDTVNDSLDHLQLISAHSSIADNNQDSLSWAEVADHLPAFPSLYIAKNRFQEFGCRFPKRLRSKVVVNSVVKLGIQ